MKTELSATPAPAGTASEHSIHAAQSDQVLESTSVPEPVPVMETTSPFVWAGLGAAITAVVLLAVMAVFLRRGKKKDLLWPPQVGKVHEQGAREYQEDCFAVTEESAAASQGLLAVVADGMGGLDAGDQVSQTAVSAIIDGFYDRCGTPEMDLLALLQLANQAVNNLLGDDRIGKCGSTLAMGLLRNNRFHYLSVGDSCVCLFRDGRLLQLNREHTFRGELLLRAVNGELSLEQASAHPQGAGLTSYLGMGQLKHVDLPAQGILVQPGDKFILMSDGVYNALSVQELAAALAHDADTAAQTIRTAIQEKNFSNQDNYTAVILAC